MAHPSFTNDVQPAIMAEASRPERAVIRSTERGRKARIDIDAKAFAVKSDNGKGTYHVRLRDAMEGEPVTCSCTCPDGTYRPGENGCHHVGSVLRRLERRGWLAHHPAAGYVLTPEAVLCGLGRPRYTEAELASAFDGLPSW